MAALANDRKMVLDMVRQVSREVLWEKAPHYDESALTLEAAAKKDRGERYYRDADRGGHQPNPAAGDLEGVVPPLGALPLALAPDAGHGVIALAAREPRAVRAAIAAALRVD